MNPDLRESGSIPVLAAVVERDGKLLICQRPAHKRHGGLWEFPGGKMEEGESILEAARRELREELGVQVVSVGDIEKSFRDPGSDFVIHFLPVAFQDDPRCIEHTEHKWVNTTELLSFPLAPTDRTYALFLAGEKNPADE